MFYGPGSVLAHLPPKKLAGLDASGCRLVVLADRMDNEISFRRKSKLDNLKSSTELELEQPVATAALWTLAGAGSVVTNQWASSFHANSRLVKRLFENLYHKDVSCLFSLDVVEGMFLMPASLSFLFFSLSFLFS